MTDTAADPLARYSERLAALVDQTAQRLVTVHGGGRVTSSGIHWRPGIVVTAEERLERDQEIAVSLPDGTQLAATLAGRDPSTDVAVLRVEAAGLKTAEIGSAAGLRVGHLALAVGRREDGAVASQGIVGFIGGPWQSLRGGTIDHFLRLDLALSPAGEGGALVDASGKVLGMTVLGPRRRALAIPASTVDRAIDQLLAKGHAARGYLGAGLQPVRLGTAEEEKRGIVVVSLDPEGPAVRAGLVIGDVITGWDGAPIGRLRDVIRGLGSDSIGREVELALLRGGSATSLRLTIGERALT